MVDESLIDTIGILNKLKIDSFKLLDNYAQYIMRNNIVDEGRIENLLDMLIDCCYDEYSVSRCLVFCDYYKRVNEENALFYSKLIKGL